MIDWRHWHNEPILIGGLIFIAWLYAVLTGPLRRYLAPAEEYPRRKATWFFLSLIIFYLAVGSPLDQIGERFLLSVHMIQHHLLTYASAVLLLLGTPAWILSPVFRIKALRPFYRLLFHPVTCGLMYSLVISLWHAPGLYDWALRVKDVHVVEHLMFYAVSLLYWWPILSPSPEYPRIGYGAQMIYLLAVTVLMTPVFAFIAFSDNVLYPTYEYAPRLFAGFMPMDDQLLGAAVMKMGSIMITMIAMIVAFHHWYRKSERRNGPLKPAEIAPV